jgi:hypothetical protein
LPPPTAGGVFVVGKAMIAFDKEMLFLARARRSFTLALTIKAPQI